jgi:pseudouridine-5'-phosphate glycosidase
VAHAAEIPIFCTGGIGGVHRDFNDSLDVSADLQELSRTPVAVISSGVKSILDIGKTLEYLETMGVCVATLNKTGSRDFPAFFTSRSGFEAPYNVRDETEAARLVRANLTTGLGSGLLIAVPIPEQYAADERVMDAAIGEALAEAARLKIKGKRVTPFLLERISKLTSGRSMEANLALIKNNARVSARIAVELFKLRNNSSGGERKGTDGRVL